MLRIRRVSLLIVAVVACGWLVAPRAQAEVEIVRLWTGYKETSAFVRLRELITGKEAPGKAVILRSTPTERSGFYYTLRLVVEAGGRLPDGEIELQVVPPDGLEPTTYRFPFLAGERRELRLDIGLTGPDWTYGNRLPLAWRLDVRDTSGQILASRQSFLWAVDEAGDPGPRRS